MADIVVQGDNGTSAIIQTTPPIDVVISGALRGPQGLPGANGADGHLAGYFNVKDYGAIGNNVADDIVAIQAAITAATPSRGTVYFPAGTYKITTPILMVSGMALKGDSRETSIIHQTATTMDGIQLTNTISCRIDDITIQGPGSGTGIGINFNWTDTIPFWHNLTNVTVKSFGGTGIKGRTVCVSNFTNVLSDANGEHGFWWSEGGTSCSWQDCWARSNAKAGWRWNGAVYQNLSACAADFNGVSYEIVDSQSICFSGSGSESPHLNGGSYNGISWRIDNSANISLLSCWITDNRNIGVHVLNTSNNATLNVVDNSPNVSATAFIKTATGTNVTIVGLNNSTANDLQGIYAILNDGGGGIWTGTDFIVPNNHSVVFKNAAGVQKSVLSVGTDDFTGLKSAGGGLGLKRIDNVSIVRIYDDSDRTELAGDLNLNNDKSIVWDNAAGTPSVTLAVGSDNATIFKAKGADIYFRKADNTSIFKLNETNNTLDMLTHKIEGVVNPTNAQDAATKSYVDGLVTGAMTNPMTSIGDIIQGTTAGAPARLASVATGNVLISGGVTTASSWGKVGLTTHVSGTLAAGNGGTGITTLGTGVATAFGLAVNGSGAIALTTSPAFVTPALGTPASGTMTNVTGLPIATGVSGLGTGIATFLATPTSANLIAAVTNETGTGALVFATSPTLVTPILGTPTSGTLTNATGLPISTGLTGAGTGVLTALGVNIGSAGAPVLFNGAGGTPTSLTLTNATGLPIGGVSATGTPSSSNFLRGDGTWSVPAGSGDMVLASTQTNTGAKTFNSATLILAGSTSGTTQLNTAAVAGTGSIITLPTGTDTLVGKATTDTFTNKTFNTAGTGNVFQINGTGITAVQGTGAVVLATTPTLTTPVLGVATATSINKVIITAPATTATLTIVNNKTFTVNNTITLSGTDAQTYTFPTATDTVAGLAAVQTITGAWTFNDAKLILAGVTSGTTTLKSGAAAGSSVITLPIATDTLVGKATTDTFTNKTIAADGTGNSITNVSSLAVKRQNDTSNSSITGVHIETGWGVFAQGAAGNKSEAVTFNTAFTTTPIVMISFGGDQTGGTIALGNGGNVEKGPVAVKAYGESTSGFTAHAHTSDGTSWSATANVYYKWYAIGA